MNARSSHAIADLFAPRATLAVFHVWGWFFWEERDDSGRAVCQSGAQSLDTAAAAVAHHNAVRPAVIRIEIDEQDERPPPVH